jgi:hypothetical protein
MIGVPHGAVAMSFGVPFAMAFGVAFGGFNSTLE